MSEIPLSSAFIFIVGFVFLPLYLHRYLKYRTSRVLVFSKPVGEEPPTPQPRRDRGDGIEW